MLFPSDCMAEVTIRTLHAVSSAREKVTLVRRVL